MELVKMAREHTAVLAELEKQCFSNPWSRQSLEEEVENPAAFFVAAVEGESILGYGGMHCSWGECYLDNIAVFSSCRGRGVGTAIVRALMEEARGRGGEFISLEARPSNTAAVSLYTRLGFREEGRRKNFYTAPAEDALILTKRFRRGKE